MKKHMVTALLCGMLGCICYGAGDWLMIFAVLKGLSLFLPVSAFRLGFINGLMSESMIIWFGIMLVWERRYVR